MSEPYSKGDVINSTEWIPYWVFWERRVVWQSAIDQIIEEYGIIPCTVIWEYRRR